MKKHYTHFFIVCLCLLWSTLGHATPLILQHGVSATIEYVKPVAQDKEIWAVVWLSIPEDYYAYAYGTSEAVGRPTVLRIVGHDDKVLPVYYPQGIEKIDTFAPEHTIQAYMGQVPLFIVLDAVTPVDNMYKGTLSLLLCSAKHCIPIDAPIEFQALPSDTHSTPLLTDEKYAVFWKNIQQVQESEKNVLTNLQEQQKVPNTSSTIPELSNTENIKWKFLPYTLQEELEVSGLGKALLLGLLAGILLNIMPCVLPVLTLKVSALLYAEGGDMHTRQRAFRLHNIFFAAGIMTQFFILAMLLGMAGFMWGQLFQSAYFVATMLVFIFALALSMFGLFTLPGLHFSHNTTKTESSPHVQAYLTGIMATLLATPCSGPLLGGVLSWVFMQPVYILVVVFLAVGLGMSAPYLLFALWPSLVVFLPRPRNWMHVVEKCMGFFLLGTSLYLLSILPQNIHISLLVGLLCVALSGWLWGYIGGLNAPTWRRRVLGSLFVVLMVGTVLYGAKPPVEERVWEDFTVAAFTANLGKEAMLLEFTADWCPNCKYVEKTVLTPEQVQAWQKKYNIRFVRVDITRHNPEGEALLHALDSHSIPVTALFGVGDTAHTPLILRDIYTKNTLEKALVKVF